jgi:hypothetical protein
MSKKNVDCWVAGHPFQSGATDRSNRSIRGPKILDSGTKHLSAALR